MKKNLVAVALTALLMSACSGESSQAYKNLRLEYDSLLVVQAQSSENLDDVLLMINDVEDGFREIKEAENYLIVQAKAMGEVDADIRTRLQSDIEFVKETLQHNQQKISNLQKELSSSRYNSEQLKKTIARLSEENAEKIQTILSLQESLEKRNVRIKELGDTVTLLSSNLTTLTQVSEQQQQQLAVQQEQLNTVWYIFGTKSELKEQNVLTGGGLFSKTQVLKEDFDKSTFIKEDLTALTEIPLYAKKAKVLTNHPANSYTLEKSDEGALTIKIVSPEQFWSLTRYLVVEVD